MYIVNTSFMVEPKVHPQWYAFMSSQFVPAVKKENLGDVFFTRVLNEQSEGHYTYSLQIHIPDMPAYQRYTNELMIEYLKVATPIFGTDATHFITLMRTLDF